MAWGSAPLIGTESVVAAGNLTLSEPAGVTSGDLLVACIAFKDSVAFSLPAGWTVVATQQNTGDINTANGLGSALMAFIVRGASAPALTFTRSGGDVAQGRILAYRPSAGTTATYATGSAGSGTSGVADQSISGLTTTQGESLLVFMHGGGRIYTVSAFDAATDPTTASGATDTATVPTNGTWIERIDASTATGSDTALGVADAKRAAAGATGAFTVTRSTTQGRSALVVGAFYEASSLNSYILTANAGSFALSGQSANLLLGRKLTGGTGALSLSGQAANLLVGRKLIGAAGAYTLGGQAATLKMGRKLSGAAGAFTLGGQAAGLKMGRKLSAGAGAFVLNGQNASLTYTPVGAYVLSAAAGSFAATGQDAGLKVGRKLTAGAGVFTVNGQDATIVHTTLGAYVITAEPGAFTVTGQAANLRYTPSRRYNVFALLTGV